MMIDAVDTDADDIDLSVYDADLPVDDDNESVESISLVRYPTEEQTVKKLRNLRKEKFRQPITFKIKSVSWTERISHEMILTFQYFKDLGYEWNVARFWDLDPETSVHANLVLQAPVTTQLFESFAFGNYGYSRRTQMETMEIQLASSIGFILRNGRGVSIGSLEIGQNAMSVLAEGLVTLAGSSVSASIPTQELLLENVSFSFDEESSSETRSAEQCLADGLARNKTLASFTLHSGRMIDSTAAIIVRSLIGHESLKKLDLSGLEFGEETASAICSLLASPTCELSDLKLSHPLRGAEFDFPSFVEQLPFNTFVKDMSFTDFGQSIDHDSANQLLRNLWKFPNLRYLDLYGTAIGDLVRLASNVAMAAPHSCLRILYLDNIEFDFLNQSITDEHVQAILHLLEVFPELCSFGENFASAIISGKFPASVTERMDLNRFSHILLRGAEIPLPVWAVVLENVDHYDPYNIHHQVTTSRQANVIYHMLHGPVFAGRMPFDL